MFDFMKNELFYALGNLLDQKIISDKTKVVCFGLNHYCRLTISFLLGAGVRKEQIFIVDNYAEGSFREISANKPKEVLCPHRHDLVILLATSHNKEMFKQLAQLGYKKNIQAYETLNVSSKLYKLGSWVRGHNPNKYNDILNGWGYRVYKKSHINICDLTEQNKKFKDIHKGKRCFIMGNGPSLKDVDFELLADEYVFGVNQIMAVEGWEKAHINYWVCCDGDFLGLLNNADYDFYKEIQKFTGRNITGFVPVEARYYCVRHDLDKSVNLNYINWKEQYINLDQQVSISHLDMSKFLMQPYNVVIACINIAIYMGFEEIYLLGCNQSVLKDELEHYLGGQKLDMHAIEEDKDSSAAITMGRMKDKGIFFEMKTQLVQLMQFRILSTYCKKNNIKLINLSNPSLIESIPRMRIEEILHK